MKMCIPVSLATILFILSLFVLAGFYPAGLLEQPQKGTVTLGR